MARSLHQPTETPVTWSIFWITMLAFPLWWMLPAGEFGAGLQLVQYAGAQTMVTEYSSWQSSLALSQWTLQQGNWHALLTHMLIHGGYPQPLPEALMVGLVHLACNMLTFLSLGRQVERAIGGSTLLALYLLSGLSGALLQVLSLNPNLDIPMVGASGAVFGVLMVYCLLFARQKLLLFFFFVARARNIGWVIFWLTLALSVVSFASQFQTMGELLRVSQWPFWLEVGVNRVAHRAHLGGALVGLIWGFAASPKRNHDSARNSRPSLPSDLLHKRARKLSSELEELINDVARSRPLSELERQKLVQLTQKTVDDLEKGDLHASNSPTPPVSSPIPRKKP